MDKKRRVDFQENAGTMELATCMNNQPHVRCMAVVYRQIYLGKWENNHRSKGKGAKKILFSMPIGIALKMKILA